MFRKNYFTFLLVISLLLVGSLAAFGQTAPLTGKVVLKKADGTTEPVAGALVEVYRTDVKGVLPSDKTNKKGEFSFAGLPVGANFVLAISAPNVKPGYYPNVKAGMSGLAIEVTEGDGKRWTEEEIRQVIAEGATASAGKAPQTSEEAKKAQADYEKQVKDIESKNQKIQQKNSIIEKSLKEGNDAFNSKNYDLAVVKYSEGVEADPELVGSAPILLNNKATAMKLRAVEVYNKAVKTTDQASKQEMLGRVKKDLEESYDAYNRSWTILKNAPPAEIANQANHDKAKYDALAGVTDISRLLAVTKVNPTKAAQSQEAFDAYLTIETDAAKKAKVQVVYADILRDANEPEKALAAYQAVLQNSPNNPDALVGAGLMLVNIAYVSNDKAKFQEASNFLQKFISVAPDTHAFKDDAKALIDTLKKEQNVTPQKTGKGKN